MGHTFLLLSACSMAWISALGYGAETSFSDIQKIFESYKCYNCHSPTGKAKLRPLAVVQIRAHKTDKILTVKLEANTGKVTNVDIVPLSK